jgi:CDP-glucose 4,6-dehydratase
MDLSASFGRAYAGRTVLVTGHTGFKGSWLCLWLTRLGAHVVGLSLPPATEPAHWPLLALADVDSQHVDLRDAAAVRSLLARTRPSVVFHFAAQSLVRRSYREPQATFDTNVLGLVNLLEAVRAVGGVDAVVNATTDKVYLERADHAYAESDPLGGHDPYSTSKACAELVSECYRNSFFAGTGTRSATARAGNVIGGGDWAEERLVPDLVRAAIGDGRVALRHPQAVRPWQHVLEPLSGYLRLGEALLAGEAVEGAWNFGPDESATLSVGEVVALFAREWPGVQAHTQPGEHPHEAATLRLDCRRAARELGWRPVWDAATTLQRTARWYRDFHERGVVGSADDLQDFVVAARAAGLAWAA